MQKINKKEIDRILEKLKDFSEKFPLMNLEDININELSKYWVEQSWKVKSVLELLKDMENEDYYMEEIKEVHYREGKGNKKIVLKNGKEIKKTD